VLSENIHFRYHVSFFPLKKKILNRSELHQNFFPQNSLGQSSSLLYVYSMKRNILYILLLSFSASTFAQSLYDEYESYFGFSSDKKHETEINRLVRFGFDDIFEYNSSDLNQYKDSLQILSKIENVTIELKKNTDLEKIIDHLTLLPNLKFLKFKNIFLLKKSIKGISFPNNINRLKKLETVLFYYYSDWDPTYGILKLSELPNLKNLGFTGFPRDLLLNESFSELKNLKGLSYSSRKGPLFPESLKSFQSLNTIILIGLEQEGIDEFRKLAQIKSLENLVISYGDINDSLAQSFADFRFLKRINFMTSKIDSPELLFSSIGRKNHLIELKLSNNELHTMPSEIKRFKDLEKFYSSNNRLGTSLPVEFYSLKRLKTVEIQGSTIEMISNEINNLSELETLKLYYNDINQFSEELDKLKKLRILYLNNNKLTKISEEITDMMSLQDLNISDNWLTAIPSNIGSLKELKTLKMDNNFVTSLPNSLSNLKNLIHLYIQNNDIQKLPDEIGKLESLKTLEASHNFISKLPSDFGKLTNLQTLDLTQNNLRDLPNSFGDLRNLEKLYLSNVENPMNYFTRFDGTYSKVDTTRLIRKLNSIQKLPNSFKNLENLKNIRLSRNVNIDENAVFSVLKNSLFFNYQLELDNCNIDSLPRSGWSTIKVKSLNVSDNNIDKLPRDIINAEFLTELNLRGNDKDLNYYRYGREQLNILFEEKGFITKEQQPKTTEMAEAYAEVANKKSYKHEYQKVIEYANRAIEIDSTAAMKKLSDDHLIEAYYHTKNYEKAIQYADKAIRKDTARGLRILNFIVPNFQYKAKSELAIGDTLSAITTLTSLAKNFNRQSWSQVGLLAKRINNDSLASTSFDHAIDFYQEYLKSEPRAWGYQLSLLEMYIIADKRKSAEELYTHLQSSVDEEDYIILLEYFGIMLEMIYDPSANINELNREFQSYLIHKKTILKTWSFRLLLNWNLANDLSIKQKAGIIELTNSLKRTKRGD